jgi:hypothetical protein
LKKYSAPERLLDKFQKSEEMEICLLEIGLESLLQTYRKNTNVDWIQLIRLLQDHGIVTALSMIIGYDFHERKNAIAEVETALSFDPAWLHLVNLRILYETKLWQHYQQEGRVLEVPPEFRALWGYQAFLHPKFNPRFKDCLPLMLELEDIIHSHIPNVYLSSLKIVKKRRLTPYNQKLIQIGNAMLQLGDRKGRE